MRMFLKVNNTNFHIPEELVTEYNYQLDPNGNAGTHGNVKKFVSQGRLPLAVKKFVLPFPTMDDDNARLLLRELNLLRSVLHPNVVRLVDKYAVVERTSTSAENAETMETIYHITVHCGAPLATVIAIGDYDMEQVKRWMRQLLSALQYIHMLDASFLDIHIIHRDLRPASICISPADGKLTLLGFSKARVLLDSRAPVTVRRGDDFYMAIEMQVPWSRAYDEKVDVWGAAVILCQMITGTVLFTWTDPDRQLRNVLEPMLEYCGPVSEDVIQKMSNTFDQDAIRRLSAGKIRTDFRDHLRSTLRAGGGISTQDIDDELHLKAFLDATLQHDVRARLTSDQAQAHPFVNPREHPSEQQPQGNANAASWALRRNIFDEIQTPVDRKAL